MPTITETDLIPVRALNQVSYCERLYWLEYVDAVMPVNEHVEEGLFHHRRVTQPELESRDRKEGPYVHTRSVALSSEKLGISGKLDLIERREGEVYPVEYKRSRAPSQPPGWYENDGIQLCAQGLLIEEELGVTVTHGILFYIGSKSRVDVPLDEALRDKTMQAIRRIRELDQLDRPPPPLPAELRHRCFGCSLAPICQPEETLFLIQRAQSGETQADSPGVGVAQPVAQPLAQVARVLPQTDEGAVLYLQEHGSFVGRRSEHLIVRKEGEELQRVPIATLRQVVIFGTGVQVSTQALECLATNEIPVTYLTPYGRFVASLVPAPTKNVNLRLDQYRAFSDPVKALALAKAAVKAKITNQRTLLMRSLRTTYAVRENDQCPNPNDQRMTNDERPMTNDADQPITPGPLTTNYDQPVIASSSDIGHSSFLGHSSLDIGHSNSGNDQQHKASQEPAARDMAGLLFRLDRINDPAVLLGTEGQAAALYFSQFHRMLKPTTARFDFTKRNRRPPRDPVNALLSFAYAILLKDCFSAALTVGFDPYYGFYHTAKHGRPALALDLMEEFRPVIADSVVLTLVNTGMLTPGDFLTWRDACQLTEPGRKKFFIAYENRKATVIRHPVFGYPMSYSRMLEVQARMLAGFVRGDIPQYIGFTVR